MTETVATPASAATDSPSLKKKGGKAAKAKSPAKVSKAAKVKASHPPSGQMVLTAVKELNEKGGSSLVAIKKYISANFKVDASKISIFIRKAIKSAVANGSLVQTKGTGASGSFKLPPKESASAASKKEKKPPIVKKAAPKKKPAPKKVEKKAAPSLPPASKKTVASKAKKAKKPPTTPKAPKPKKAKAPAKKTSPAKPKAAAKKPASKRAAPRKK